LPHAKSPKMLTIPGKTRVMSGKKQNKRKASSVIPTLIALREETLRSRSVGVQKHNWENSSGFLTEEHEEAGPAGKAMDRTHKSGGRGAYFGRRFAEKGCDNETRPE